MEDKRKVNMKDILVTLLLLTVIYVTFPVYQTAFNDAEAYGKEKKEHVCQPSVSPFPTEVAQISITPDITPEIATASPTIILTSTPVPTSIPTQTPSPTPQPTAQPAIASAPAQIVPQQVPATGRGKGLSIED